MATLNETIIKADLLWKDDLGTTATGDYPLISGLDNIRQRILRRLLTVPGSLAHRPDYGAGIPLLQGAPVTIAVQRQMALAIKDNLTDDPAINSVLEVSVKSEDSTPATLTITVKVEVDGYGEVEQAFTGFEDLRID